MKHISVDELTHKLKGGERLQLIDVRSIGEFATAHIPGAVNLPLEQVEARVRDLNDHDPVVLVCQSGRRACIGYELLEGARDDVMILDGGTKAWISTGHETVSGVSAKWSLERQVRLIAGLLALIGSALALAVNPSWAFLSLFIGAGLSFAGLTDICGMAAILKLLPWNKPKSVANLTASTEATR